MKDDRLYLIHINECIQRIEEYTSDGRDHFFLDEKTRDAVLRNLQTLAESSQRLSDVLKANHLEVDWKSISGFRNVVVHDYLGIDIHRIWEIVSVDLPDLKKKIQVILQK